jgi:hypothetical protein
MIWAQIKQLALVSDDFARLESFRDYVECSVDHAADANGVALDEECEQVLRLRRVSFSTDPGSRLAEFLGDGDDWPPRAIWGDPGRSDA